MKRVFGVVAVLVALGLAGAFVPVDAQSCIRCPNFFGWTPGQWGMGSSCAIAEQNAIAAAWNYAYSQCYVCDEGLTEIVTPCMIVEGQWKADARVQYKCEINLCY